MKQRAIAKDIVEDNLSAELGAITFKRDRHPGGSLCVCAKSDQKGYRPDRTT